MFEAFYNKKRFKYIHDDLLKSGLISNYKNETLIPKSAVLIGKDLNIYIDTSDGVNEDLEIYEYCGRIKRIVDDCKGKPFLFFKSAYSNKWTKRIEEIAISNNGKVIPFFKWSFNDSFYQNLLGNRKSFIKKNNIIHKKYDVGIFFHDKPYLYPKPSEFDKDISFSDHQKFGLPGSSRNTGHYNILSRKFLIDTLKKSKFKILHVGSKYEDYLKQSLNCKVIINPPGIGEYTSRMVDQTYLGNCIVMRKNSYDNGLSWKNHIPEIDFKSKDWEQKLNEVILNVDYHRENCKDYYQNFWTSKAIVDYFIENVR